MPIPNTQSTLNDDGTVSRVLTLASLLLFGIFTAISLSHARNPAIDFFRTTVNVLAACICLFCFVLVRLGKPRLGSYILVFGLWVTVSVSLWHLRNLYAHTALLYPLLIILGGWLCGTWPTLWLTAATLVYFFGFYSEQPTGFLQTGETPPHILLITLLTLSSITAGATLISRKSYLKHIRQVEEKSNLLQRASVEVQKLSWMIEQSPDSVVIVDMQRRIEYVNEAFLNSLGYTRTELLGRDAALVRSPKTVQETYPQVTNVVLNHSVWRGELWSRKKNGEEILEEAVVMPLFDASGTLTHVATISVDASKRKQIEADLYRLSNFDALTGLPNRQHLTTKLEQLISHPSLQPYSCTLLLLNLDRFKDFSEARGESATDMLLKMCADRLLAVTHKRATLARLTDNGFVILLSPDDTVATREDSHRKTMELIHDIRRSMEEPLAVDVNDDISLSSSLGVVFFPHPGTLDTVSDILRAAKMACSQTHKSGNNNTVFFDEAMGARAFSRYQTEVDLRRALKGDELRLYLQSQVDAQGNYVGAEVLVRWFHPQRGLISPAAFIGIAEESDLIIDLSRWILGESCKLIAQEEAMGRPLHLSVNISPKHFARADFLPSILQFLADSDIDPSRLTLELTEGHLIEQLDDAVSKMNKLSSLGLRLSIDDFGTGYSSLAYLKHLPITELKIDKIFVQNASLDRKDAALVEAILVISERMNLRVVAEGVETLEHAQFFNSFPTVIRQGYLYGRPEESSDWLQRWRSTPLIDGGLVSSSE